MDPLSILGVLSSLSGLFGGGKPQEVLKSSAPIPQLQPSILGALAQPPNRINLGVDASLPGAAQPQVPSYPSLTAKAEPSSLQKDVQKGLNKKVTPKTPADDATGGLIRASSSPDTNSFLGLSDKEWSSIGAATGILAKLFETQPAPAPLKPTIQADNSVPVQALGQGLAGPSRALNIATGSAPSFPSQDMSKLMRRS